MRNGDFLPTRLQAQQDAVGMITQAKLRSNPESNVGLLSLSDLDVLVTLTTDTGKVLAKLHAVQPKGQIKLVPAIKIAHLALKHRLGKNHKTRIITFVGSPITSDEKELIKVAKKLKKEKVSVDVVSFGEVDENAEILKKFVETVNGRDGTGSHLVTIPPGPHLSDALISSAIIQDGETAVPVASNGGSGFEFGFDPNEDPELALALRVSMEENRARLAKEDNKADGAVTVSESLISSDSTTKKENDELTKGGGFKFDIDTTDDPELAFALRLSMENNSAGEINKLSETTNKESDKEEKMDVEESSAKASASKPVPVDEGEEDYSEVMNDPEFLQSVLESLPGVDPQSEAMRQAMGALTGSAKKDSSKEDKKDDDKNKK